MNCDEIRNVIDCYLDGELDPITSRKVEEHLRGCPNCQEKYEADTVLVGAIGHTAPYYKAPPELHQRVRASLRDAIAVKGRDAIQKEQPLGRTQAREQWRPPSAMPWNWLALAAAVLLLAIMISNLLPRSQRPGMDELLSTQLIASHARSLMANHLTDVASSDQHTVKPWLDTKLDFAPPVLDLSTEGFPLVGGRLDYLVNRPVAALIYQRRKHFINLFVWPVASGEVTGSKAVTRQGYQLLHWSDSEFNYWAVSDVSMNDLEAFKQLFTKQLSNH